MKDKKEKELDANAWKLVNVHGIPYQTNGSDCGVFCCTFMDYVSSNLEFDFSQENMPLFRKRLALCIMKKKIVL